MLAFLRSISCLLVVVKFVFKMLVLDRLCHASEVKSAFLGHDLITAIVAQAKAEVASQTDGSEYVSTQDVVAAWFLRAALAAEKDSSSTLAFSGVFCFRGLLARNSLADLAVYPHCAVYSFPVTPAPTLRQLAAAPLSSFALAHRRSLLRARTPASLASLFRYMRHHGWRMLVPVAGWGVEPFLITNQVDAGLPGAVDWSAVVPGLAGGEGRGAFMLWSTPRGMDHFMMLNEVEGGWLWSGGMRRGRWASLEGALAELAVAGTQAKGRRDSGWAEKAWGGESP